MIQFITNFFRDIDLEMMESFKKGEGPMIWITHEGRTYFNINKFMKSEKGKQVIYDLKLFSERHNLRPWSGIY
jgi:hypothetical protein